MNKKTLALSKVYHFIEPGPVAMLTTSQNGKQNVMTMSWRTMLDFEPPLIGCVISNRNYTYNALKKTKECVMAIPTVEIAPIVVKVGNTSGRDIDKFKKFNLTPVPALNVKAPLIGECYVNLECKIVDTSMVNKYGLFVMEVVKAWINPDNKNPKTIHHQGMGTFMVAGETIKLPSKMR